MKKASGKASIIRSTKKGDAGKTSLLSGERVSKTDIRLEVGGNLDESNAALGLAKSLTTHQQIRAIIATLQSHLLMLGSEISCIDPSMFGKRIEEEQILQLEGWIEDLQKEAPLPRRFVDPGGNPVSAAIDLARAIMRRTERSMILMGESGFPLRQELLSYVNRLSFLVFVLARYAEATIESEASEIQSD
ncbi:MAG: cob(I)yrinic acid a,c-diamide adenosyltransferase [Syntrophobacteraceae bacterium]